ncbi:hypothetical protein ZIOFF_064589 [Zingiber officinale]|uniref:ubiquitinyl hydrolase 1 n=1 Tax=Zingiber officinale TaxID=94328 RepID=A0A8J5EWX7_ZINOF|nr:hypothetical protein ZIOFF_064589 [Zingiber officinale]
MTRIFVQRGSSSNSNRPPSNSTPPSSQASSTSKDDPEKQIIEDQNVIEDSGDRLESVEDKISKHDESSQVINVEGATNVYEENKSSINDVLDSSAPRAETSEHHLGQEDALRSGIVPLVIGSPQIATGASYPPPPPAPPLKPFLTNQSSRRMGLGSSNSVRIGSSRRQTPWPVVGARSPSNSRPSSPMSYGEGDGYNSADEQGPGYATSYGDVERERLFVLEIRRTKGFEVRKMLEDGNCLFRAVADQVYGDAEAYDMARQMCVDYLVYGNNIEIQAFAEMYNRPIHIYSYSTGSYVTDVPPIRLSYHHGNHYNSLVDPRRMTVGAGLGFNSLRGRNIDKDQIKTAIKAQQDQQLDNALIAEGRFYSDLELTEKEIERMVMEASRAEYLAKEKLKQYAFSIESSTSSAEPSSSVASMPLTISGNHSSQTFSPWIDEEKTMICFAETGSSQSILEGENEKALLPEIILSSSMQMVLSMGFGYMQAMEAYSIFGDDVDSMICYLLEMGNNGASAGERRNGYKGKAAE